MNDAMFIKETKRLEDLDRESVTNISKKYDHYFIVPFTSESAMS